MQILWVLTFLAFFATCLYFIVQTFNTYFSWPSFWAIDYIQEIPTNFTAVTICNRKLLDTSKPATKAWIAANLQHIPGPDTTAFFNNYYEWNWFTRYNTRVLLATDTTLNSTTKKALGFQIEDMLLSCEFNAKPCNSSDFNYYFHRRYGNCYTWNYGTPALKTSLAERDGGLTLELYLGNPANDTIYNNIDGVYISIHNQSDIPFSKNPVIIAATGVSSNFILKKNIVKKLQPPYGTCMEDGFSSDLHDYIVNSGITYSQEYCFSLCFGELFFSTCGCILVDFPTMNSTARTCSQFSATDNACGRSIFVAMENETIVATCTAKCPSECYQVEYEMNTFQARYPTDFWIPYLYNKTISKGLNVSYSDISKAYALIDISLGSMVYKYSAQTQQFQSTDLLGNLGGVMGFWIGGGLMSLVEIIQLGFDITRTLINYCLVKRQISKNIFPNNPNQIIKY